MQQDIPRLIPFWNFQEALLQDTARMILICWARGNGKSFCLAAKIVMCVFRDEARGKPSDWIIASATREQS